MVTCLFIGQYNTKAMTQLQMLYSSWLDQYLAGWIEVLSRLKTIERYDLFDH